MATQSKKEIIALITDLDESQSAELLEGEPVNYLKSLLSSLAPKDEKKEISPETAKDKAKKAFNNGIESIDQAKAYFSASGVAVGSVVKEIHCTQDGNFFTNIAQARKHATRTNKKRGEMAKVYSFKLD